MRFGDKQKTAAQEIVLTKNKQLTELYKNYKNKIALNVGFSSTGNQSESNGEQKNLSFFPASVVRESNLEIFEIHFDTSTYDKVDKDIKITLEAQLGLIGGTMGLLTGFSILSGVEIIYFVGKFFCTLLYRKS